MKRLLASLGLVAVGATTLQAQYAPGLSALERTKWWTVSAALRGFYDDNFLTLPSNQAESSWGLDFSPSIAINHSVENTLISASYVYDLKHYDTQGINDQTHQINAKFDHAFSESYRLQLNESFVIGQEPTVLSPVAVTSPLRIDGSNIRNYGSVDFQADITQDWGLGLNYANTLYSYDNATNSALLDGIEQSVGPDLRWRAQKDTTVILGYRYGNRQYTSSTPIGIEFGFPVSSSKRNNQSHLAQVGVDHQFSPDLSASLRVGPQYFDYYNDHQSVTSPYVDAFVSYSYMKDCLAQLGIKQIHNPSDLLISAQNPILDEASTVPYLSITHAITPKLTAGAMFQWQHSVVQGSVDDGQTEEFLSLSLNLAYQFNPYLMAEAGYNYNNLNSDFNRGYSRNIGYLGVRATY